MIFEHWYRRFSESCQNNFDINSLQNLHGDNSEIMFNLIWLNFMITTDDSDNESRNQTWELQTIIYMYVSCIFWRSECVVNIFVILISFSFASHYHDCIVI